MSVFRCRGKHRPTYTPSVDMGGFVVVVNAEKVIVTGSKASQKLYKRHTTGRPGSMKEETFEQLQAVRMQLEAITLIVLGGTVQRDLRACWRHATSVIRFPAATRPASCSACPKVSAPVEV